MAQPARSDARALHGHSGRIGAPAESRPRLIFFYSVTSGPCRRTEAHLSQVLQRRHNHETFDLTRVSVDQRPDLVARFGIDAVPTILVVDGQRIRGRIVQPPGPPAIAAGLRTWLH